MKNSKVRYRICYKLSAEASEDWREIAIPANDAFEAINTLTNKFGTRYGNEPFKLAALTCIPVRDPKPGRPKKNLK